MINIKTAEEIEKMKVGGRILSEVLSQVISNIKPGVSEKELDNLAEKLILQKGAEPGFKKVKDYKNTICTSTNSVVVHGIPTKYKFKEGDVVGVDCGVYYKGFHTDMSETIKVKSQKSPASPKLKRGEKVKSSNEDKVDRFLKVGKKALNEAIKIAQVGNRVGHISKTIQDIVEKESGYSVVRTLVGHGVGRLLHEEPEIPGFLAGSINSTPLLRSGMTIAIEVIYNMGKHEVLLSKDGWTIKTKDNSISGVFEKTIVVTNKGPIVLTG